MIDYCISYCLFQHTQKAPLSTPFPEPGRPLVSQWSHQPLRWSLCPRPPMEQPHPNVWKSLMSFPTLVWRRQRDQASWRGLSPSSSEASPRSRRTPYSPVLLGSMLHMPLCWLLQSLVSNSINCCIVCVWTDKCLHNKHICSLKASVRVTQVFML